MSSAMELLNNKGTFREKRLFRTSKVTDRSSWRDRSPKRSSSRPRSSSKKMIQVRIKKTEKPKAKKTHHIKDKLIKKKTEQRQAPEAPHNTTQYIIDANTCAETPDIYGEDFDQFQFSFNHHPMAGSMMSMMSRFSEPSSFSHNGLGFMGEKFTQLLGDCTEASSNCEDVVREENGQEEDNRLVNSISSEQETDLGQGGNELCGDYSQYLRQSENGGDLQETIKNLVDLLKQKDQQIEDMKSIYL